MIVDGDVKTLDAGARIAVGAITGGADAGLCEAAQLLDIQVEEIAGGIAFIADNRRFGRFQRREAIKMMAAQDARKRGLGDRQNRHNLSVGAALAAQLHDPGFELRGSLARLVFWGAGTVLESGLETFLFGAGEPAPDGFFA